MGRDVTSDAAARRRLERLGARSVPVVARGGRWVYGVDLAQVAALAGVPIDARPPLPPAVLIERLRGALAAASRLIGQFPPANLQDALPGRDRTCLALANHVLEIGARYLQAQDSGRFDPADSESVPAQDLAPDALEARRRALDARLAGCPLRIGGRTVQAFFGETSLHAILERSAWHAAQHARQLAALLEALGIAPDRPLRAADLDGLPLPAGIWDSDRGSGEAAE